MWIFTADYHISRQSHNHNTAHNTVGTLHILFLNIFSSCCSEVILTSLHCNYHIKPRFTTFVTTLFERTLSLEYIITILITILNVNLVPSFYPFSLSKRDLGHCSLSVYKLLLEFIMFSNLGFGYPSPVLNSMVEVFFFGHLWLSFRV